MAGRGGKSKATKKRSKKTSKAAAKGKAEVQNEKNEKISAQATGGNSMVHDKDVTEQQLQAAEDEISNAPLFSDSDDYDDSSELSDGACYPSSPPTFPIYLPYEQSLKTVSPNASQVDIAKHDKKDENANAIIGSINKVDEEAGSKKSSYPTLATQHAVEVFEPPLQVMGPPPRVSSKPLAEQSKDKANVFEPGGQAQQELYTDLLSYNRPLPKTPAAADPSVDQVGGNDINLLDKMFDQALANDAIADLEESGDKNINMFAEAKAREMEEQEEYDPAKFNLNDVDAFKRDNRIVFANEDKMDYTMETDELGESSPQRDQNVKRTPTTSEANHSQPSSPHNAIVECPSKKTAHAMEDHLIVGAQYEDVTREIKSIISAAQDQTSGDGSDVVGGASSDNATQLPFDQDVRGGIARQTTKLLKTLATEAMRALANNELSKQGQAGTPMQRLPDEQVTVLMNRGLKVEGASAHTKTTMDTDKQIVDDAGDAEWLGEAMKNDIAEEAKRSARSNTGGGDILVAINDNELIDLDQAEPPKPKPKKKSGNKKKKSNAKKAAAFNASASASCLDDSYTTTGEHSQTSTTDRSEAETQAMAESMAGVAVDVVTLGQMRQDTKADTSARETVKKIWSPSEEELQALMKKHDFSEDDLRKLAAIKLAEPASKISKAKLQELAKNFDKQDYGAFVHENKKAQGSALLSKDKEQVVQFLGQVDSGTIKSLHQIAEEEAAKNMSELTAALSSGDAAGGGVMEDLNAASEMAQGGSALGNAVHQILGLAGKYDEFYQAIDGLTQLTSLLQQKMEVTDNDVIGCKKTADELADKQASGITLVRALQGNLSSCTYELNSLKKELDLLKERLVLVGQGSSAGESQDGNAPRSSAGFMDSQYHAFNEEFKDVRVHIKELHDISQNAIKDMGVVFKRQSKEHRAFGEQLGVVTSELRASKVLCDRVEKDVGLLRNDAAVLDNRLRDVDLRFRHFKGTSKGAAKESGDADNSAEVSRWSTDLEMLTSATGAIRRDLGDVSAKMDAHLAKVAKHEKAFNAVGTMRNDIAGLQKTAKATKTTVEEHTQELASLKGGSEKTSEGLTDVTDKISSAISTVNTVKSQVARVIAEQNTFRKCLGEAGLAADARDREVSAALRTLQDSAEKNVKKTNRKADEYAKKVSELSDKVEEDLKKNDAQSQKLESYVNGNVTKIEKKLDSNYGQLRSNIGRIDMTNSQLNRLWGAFEREVGPVESLASGDGAVSRIDLMSLQVANLMQAQEARAEAAGKTKPAKKKTEHKAEEKPVPRLTLHTVNAKVDQANATIEALQQQLADLQIALSSRPVLAHATSQTDLPPAGAQGRDAVPATPQVAPTTEHKPRVRIPQLDRVVSGHMPATPAALSPAPMLPHPTPPGSASLGASMQQSPPPVIGSQAQGHGHVVTTPDRRQTLDQQQRPRVVSQAQPFANQPFASPAHAMMMDRAMMTPAGAFGGPFMGQMAGGISQTPAARVSSMMNGPPGFMPRAGVPLHGFGFPQMTPPLLEPTGDPAFDYQNMVISDMWHRLHEMSNVMSFYGDSLRQSRQDIRYELGVHEGTMEQRINERFNRVHEEFDQRLKAKEEEIRKMQMQTQMETLMLEMMRKLGMTPPPGFGQ